MTSCKLAATATVKAGVSGREQAVMTAPDTRKSRRMRPRHLMALVIVARHGLVKRPEQKVLFSE
jgi:hypothetical protein